MDAEGLGRGQRSKVPTEKARLLEEAKKLKDAKARERAEKKVQSSQTEAEMDQLSTLFRGVNVDMTEADLVAAFTSMGMGGRRKRTKKQIKKSRRKTRR
jgi:hypothetical protein